MAKDATDQKKAGNLSDDYPKKDYGHGPVPKQSRFSKIGKTNKKGYTGPPTIQGGFPR